MYRAERYAALADSMHFERIPASILQKAAQSNPWFDDRSVKSAVDAIRTDMLDPLKLEQWLSAYPEKDMTGISVGIVMPGNIPLVGFFDLLCVLVLGAEARVKLSSKDRILMEWCISEIRRNIPEARIDRLSEDDMPDAVIATGSNNANRYFKSAYEHIPAMLRGNRTSIAVLTGNESPGELDALWEDVFTYYGLGCRNVSHLLLPRSFNLQALTNRWQAGAKTVRHPKFRNNYLQNRAVMLMEGIPFFDGSYFTMSENCPFAQPLGHITYSFYSDMSDAENWIGTNRERLQCIVSSAGVPGETALGQSQHPQLIDYADDKDLIVFLLSI